MSETIHRTIPEEIIRDIKCVSNVALFTHSHPDGDALGSILGLASLLESLGKKVFCLLKFEEIDFGWQTYIYICILSGT